MANITLNITGPVPSPNQIAQMVQHNAVQIAETLSVEHIANQWSWMVMFAIIFGSTSFLFLVSGTVFAVWYCKMQRICLFRKGERKVSSSKKRSFKGPNIRSIKMPNLCCCCKSQKKQKKASSFEITVSGGDKGQQGMHAY